LLEPLRAAIQTIPDPLPGLGGRALPLVDFTAALRPSELSGHDTGSLMFLPWRENDQEAHATTLWLPAGQTGLCPVTALDAWLGAAQITEGGPAVPAAVASAACRFAQGPRRMPVADCCQIGTNPLDATSTALFRSHLFGAP
jgi:hypothetical protein